MDEIYAFFDQYKEAIKKDFINHALEDIVWEAYYRGTGNATSTSISDIDIDRILIPNQTHLIRIDHKSFIESSMRRYKTLLHGESPSSLVDDLFKKAKNNFFVTTNDFEEGMYEWLKRNIDFSNLGFMMEGMYNYASQKAQERKFLDHRETNHSEIPEILEQYKKEFKVSKWKKVSEDRYDEEHTEENAKKHGWSAALYNVSIVDFIDSKKQELRWADELLRNFWLAANWTEVQDEFDDNATEWLYDGFFDQETNWIWEEGFEEDFWDGFWEEINLQLKKEKENIIKNINRELPSSIEDNFYPSILDAIGFNEDEELKDLIKKINSGKALPESLFYDGDDWQEIINYINEIDEESGFPDYLNYLRKIAVQFANKVVNFISFYPSSPYVEDRRLDANQLNFTDEIDQHTNLVQIQSKWKKVSAGQPIWGIVQDLLDQFYDPEQIIVANYVQQFNKSITVNPKNLEYWEKADIVSDWRQEQKFVSGLFDEAEKFFNSFIKQYNLNEQEVGEVKYYFLKEIKLEISVNIINKYQKDIYEGIYKDAIKVGKEIAEYFMDRNNVELENWSIRERLDEIKNLQEGYSDLNTYAHIWGFNEYYTANNVFAILEQSDLDPGWGTWSEGIEEGFWSTINVEKLKDNMGVDTSYLYEPVPPSQEAYLDPEQTDENEAKKHRRDIADKWKVQYDKPNRKRLNWVTEDDFPKKRWESSFKKSNDEEHTPEKAKWWGEAAAIHNAPFDDYVLHNRPITEYVENSLYSLVYLMNEWDAIVDSYNEETQDFIYSAFWDSEEKWIFEEGFDDDFWGGFWEEVNKQYDSLKREISDDFAKALENEISNDLPDLTDPYYFSLKNKIDLLTELSQTQDEKEYIEIAIKHLTGSYHYYVYNDLNKLLSESNSWPIAKDAIEKYNQEFKSIAENIKMPSIEDGFLYVKNRVMIDLSNLSNGSISSKSKIKFLMGDKEATGWLEDRLLSSILSSQDYVNLTQIANFRGISLDKIEQMTKEWIAEYINSPEAKEEVYKTIDMPTVEGEVWKDPVDPGREDLLGSQEYDINEERKRRKEIRDKWKIQPNQPLQWATEEDFPKKPWDFKSKVAAPNQFLPRLYHTMIENLKKTATFDWESESNVWNKVQVAYEILNDWYGYVEEIQEESGYQGPEYNLDPLMRDAFIDIFKPVFESFMYVDDDELHSQFETMHNTVRQNVQGTSPYVIDNALYQAYSDVGYYLDRQEHPKWSPSQIIDFYKDEPPESERDYEVLRKNEILDKWKPEGWWKGGSKWKKVSADEDEEETEPETRTLWEVLEDVDEGFRRIDLYREAQAYLDQYSWPDEVWSYLLPAGVFDDEEKFIDFVDDINSTPATTLAEDWVHQHNDEIIDYLVDSINQEYDYSVFTDEEYNEHESSINERISELVYDYAYETQNYVINAVEREFDDELFDIRQNLFEKYRQHLEEKDRRIHPDQEMMDVFDVKEELPPAPQENPPPWLVELMRQQSKVSNNLDPIAYITNSGDYLCPNCALEEYGQDESGRWPKEQPDGSPSPVAPWDEWEQEHPDAGPYQMLVCEKCGETLDDYENPSSIDWDYEFGGLSREEIENKKKEFRKNQKDLRWTEEMHNQQRRENIKNKWEPEGWWKGSSAEDWSQETEILIDYVLRDNRIINPAIDVMEKIVQQGGSPEELTNWTIENVLNEYNDQIAQQWEQVSDEEDIEDQKQELRRTWKQQARKQFPFSLKKQKQYVQEMEQMQFGLFGEPEPENIENYLLKVENIDWQSIYDWIKEDLQYRRKMASSNQRQYEIDWTDSTKQIFEQIINELPQEIMNLAKERVLTKFERYMIYALTPGGDIDYILDDVGDNLSMGHGDFLNREMIPNQLPLSFENLKNMGELSLGDPENSNQLATFRDFLVQDATETLLEKYLGERPSDVLAAMEDIANSLSIYELKNLFNLFIKTWEKEWERLFKEKTSSHGQNQMAIGDEVAETTFEGVEVDPDPEPEEKIINGKKWKMVRPKPNKQPADYAKPKGGWGFYSSHEEESKENTKQNILRKAYSYGLNRGIDNFIRLIFKKTNRTPYEYLDYTAIKNLPVADRFYDENQLSLFREMLEVNDEIIELAKDDVSRFFSIAKKNYFNEAVEYWLDGYEAGIKGIYKSQLEFARAQRDNPENWRQSKKDAWEAVLDGELGHDILTTGTWEEVKKQTIKWLKQFKNGFLNKKNPHDNKKIDAEAKEQDAHAIEDLKLYEEKKRWSFHFDHGKHPYDLIIQPVGYKESKWIKISTLEEEHEEYKKIYLDYKVEEIKKGMPNYLYEVGKNEGWRQLTQAKAQVGGWTTNDFVENENNHRSYNPDQLTFYDEYINENDKNRKFLNAIKTYIIDKLEETKLWDETDSEEFYKILEEIKNQFNMNKLYKKYDEGFNLAFTQGPQDFYNARDFYNYSPKDFYSKVNGSKTELTKDNSRRLTQVGNNES